MDHVALLSAIPRSYEEIVAGETDRTKDYIRTQMLKNLNTPKSAWETLRPYLKDKADELFDWCRGAGGKVVEQAGLQELADALANQEIVIVLAHWKGPAIHPKDLPDVVEGITKVAHTLGVGKSIPTGASARAARLAVEPALNRRIESWLDWVDLGEGDMIVGDYYGRCLAREQLDAAMAEECASSLVPGARLELSDGLWSAGEIASCFPGKWDGICDFVCCRSLYLSDVVKSHTRTGLIRADARELRPERVLEVVGHTLQAVAEGYAYHTSLHRMEKYL